MLVYGTRVGGGEVAFMQQHQQPPDGIFLGVGTLESETQTHTHTHTRECVVVG